MNIYLVVEGSGEIKVYRKWVTYVNPELTYVSHVSEIRENNFSIISGGGYPQYFEKIVEAIADVNDYANIDRLVIAVDSEDMGYEEKIEEVKENITVECRAEIRIVIQHFCIETWALGNRLIVKRNPQCKKLREYVRLHDVRVDDPELLPANRREGLNRSQFAEEYLKRALRDRHAGNYSKSNPKVLMEEIYFERVRQRFDETGHIASFGYFIEAFG